MYCSFCTNRGLGNGFIADVVIGSVTSYLSTVVIVTKTNSACTGQAISPETADLDVGLRHASMGDQKPDTKDGLGQNIQDSIGNDLAINGNMTSAISDTPDAARSLARIDKDR